MSTYFKLMFMCRECGALDDGMGRFDFCSECGGRHGSEKVSVEFSKGMFRDKFLGIKDSCPSAFQIRLARLLDIEADGGDDPASVLAAMMVRAAVPSKAKQVEKDR